MEGGLHWHIASWPFILTEKEPARAANLKNQSKSVNPLPLSCSLPTAEGLRANCRSVDTRSDRLHCRAHHGERTNRDSDRKQSRCKCRRAGRGRWGHL